MDEQLQDMITGLKVVDDDIDYIIIKERNEAIRQITQDVEELYQLNLDLATLFFEHGQQIDIIDKSISNIEIAVEHSVDDIRKASIAANTSNSWLSNVAIILTSTGVGLLGWLGGPIVGIPTTMAGIGVGSSIVYRRKE